MVFCLRVLRLVLRLLPRTRCVRRVRRRFPEDCIVFQGGELREFYRSGGVICNMGMYYGGAVCFTLIIKIFLYFIWVYHFRPFYLFYLFILDLFIYFICFSLSYGAIHIQSINQLIILLKLYAWGYYSDYMYIHSLKINSFSFNTLTFFSFCIMPYLISGSNGQNSDLIYLNKRFEVCIRS